MQQRLDFLNREPSVLQSQLCGRGGELYFGGSGGFLDLAVVEERDGKAVNSAVLYLGDRLRVHALTIVDGKIVLDVTMHAPDDPMCCPSLRTTRRFQLERGGLVEDSGE